jgi:hypothetical protein
MDAFFLIVFGGIGLVVLALFLLGRGGPSINQLTGRADERRMALQAQIEEGEVAEMVDAHNESRRRRGKEEVTETEIRDAANRAQRESIGRARASDE